MRTGANGWLSWTKREKNDTRKLRLEERENKNRKLRFDENKRELFVAVDGRERKKR
jgi:hypothetical protein